MLHCLKISSCLEECVPFDLRSLVYACLISMLIICMFVVPTFFNVCGGHYRSMRLAARGSQLLLRTKSWGNIFTLAESLCSSG
jgi:hypothetical protein